MTREATAWGCLLVFDTAVFILTVVKTFSTRKTILQGTGLLSVLLRDGLHTRNTDAFHKHYIVNHDLTFDAQSARSKTYRYPRDKSTNWEAKHYRSIPYGTVPEEKPDQMDESAPYAWRQSRDGFRSEWYPNGDSIPLDNVSEV
ncbi:hypothetical protein H0H93_008771 [Arthromyces matolae]|nr:hypothetical protein H0H93_008771 [Arthromyces matolae]